MMSKLAERSAFPELPSPSLAATRQAGADRVRRGLRLTAHWLTSCAPIFGPTTPDILGGGVHRNRAGVRLPRRKLAGHSTSSPTSARTSGLRASREPAKRQRGYCFREVRGEGNATERRKVLALFGDRRSSIRRFTLFSPVEHPPCRQRGDHRSLPRSVDGDLVLAVVNPDPWGPCPGSHRAPSAIFPPSARTGRTRPGTSSGRHSSGIYPSARLLAQTRSPTDPTGPVAYDSASVCHCP